MSEQIKQITQRIKGLREIEGISVESMAKEFNISIDIYRAYEDGTKDIPVSFLYAIANKFNVELTALITGGNPKLHSYSLVRKDKGVQVERNLK